MSGVKNLAQAESGGLKDITNEDLIEEGRGSAVAEDAKEKKDGEKE